MTRRTSAPRRNPNAAHTELETLLDDVDDIERILEPLQGSPIDALRTQLEYQRKKLEAVDEEEVSSFRLSILRKEISRLRAKAEALANNSIIASTSILHNQLDDIQRTLETIPDTDAKALRSQLEAKKNILDSADKQKLPSVQEEILALKESADNLSTRTFLFNEIDRIEKMLVTAKSKPFSKRSGWEALEEEKIEKKVRLQAAGDTELASLRKEIGELKESAESFADSEPWREKLGRISPLIWLGIIPLLIVCYASLIAITQWNNQTLIHTYASETAAAMPTFTQTATPTAQTTTPALPPTQTSTAAPVTTP